MMPDPGYIADRRDKLVGLVITHAHEDHIGAVAWLWPQLRCPVYATPFAAAVLRRKLAEVQLLQPGEAARRAAGRGDRPAAVRAALPARDAFDPRGAGAGDRHAARHCCCTPAIGSSIRSRWSARRPTRRRSPRWASAACWRWSAIPPMRWSRAIPAARPRCAQSLDRADARAARPGRGHLLRHATSRGVESVALAAHDGRPQRRAGRPLAAQPRRRGARVRLSRATSRRS